MRHTLAGLLCATASLAAGTAMAPHPAHAAAAASPYTTAYQQCIDGAGGVTIEMVECMNAEHARQDRRLNQAYQALRAQLSAGQRKSLQEAQRAWIVYRDANCAFYFDPEGGSLARITANYCMMDMTLERAAELEKMREP